MIFEQIPVALTLDSITQFMPYLIVAIPSERQECKANELSIEYKLDEQTLIHRNTILAHSRVSIDKLLNGGRNSAHITCTISEIKEQSIKANIIKLAAMVQNEYLETLLSLGIDIENASHRTRQRVEIPFTLLDLYPGDTRIHYKLYTKRELYAL